ALQKPERTPAPPIRESASETHKTETPAILTQPKLPPYTAIASEPDRRRWLVDQLRAAGVPNDIVARFVLAEVDTGWQKRFDNAAPDSRGNPDAMVALHLEQEKDTDAQMRAALGEAGFKRWDQERLLREANIGKIELTPTEADAIYDLKKKLQQRGWDLE